MSPTGATDTTPAAPDDGQRHAEIAERLARGGGERDHRVALIHATLALAAEARADRAERAAARAAAHQDDVQAQADPYLAVAGNVVDTTRLRPEVRTWPTDDLERTTYGTPLGTRRTRVFIEIPADAGGFVEGLYRVAATQLGLDTAHGASGHTWGPVTDWRSSRIEVRHEGDFVAVTLDRDPEDQA